MRENLCKEGAKGDLCSKIGLLIINLFIFFIFIISAYFYIVKLVLKYPQFIIKIHSLLICPTHDRLLTKIVTRTNRRTSNNKNKVDNAGML